MVAKKLRRQATEKPAVREAMEQANRKAQSTMKRHADRVRHRLQLDDSILSARGLRPWEQDQNSP